MIRSLVATITLLLLGSYSVHGQCTASINQTYTMLCVGDAGYLTATSGANNYQWFQNGTPVGINSDTLHLIGLAPGSYQYTVEINFGSCTDTSGIANVSVIPLPTATASSNNPCVGGTLNLMSGFCTGCTFSWNGPLGFSSVQANPSIPNVQTWNSGVYMLCVNSGGCSACDTVQVNIVSGTAVTATSNGDVCFGDTLELSVTTVTGATYGWYGPGGFTSTQQNPSIPVTSSTQGGTYTVNVFQGGCVSSDTALATICNTLWLNMYYDVNSNCSYDVGTDHNPNLPILVKIDSNSVPVDTLSITSGLFYTAGGVAGDVYSFTLLSLPGGMIPTCPVTGTTNHTLQTNSLNTIEMGIECGTTNGFDLGIYASNPNTSATTQSGAIYLTNSYCNPTNATVTLQHSPKYLYSTATPTPTSISGNTITWNLTNLSAGNQLPTNIYYHLAYSTAPLIAGDTTNSYFSIAPTTGDANPNNNTWTKHDTVIASFDPNAIMAYPETCIESGDQLQYTIMFENVGNAPAENIYVLDTLPAELDANSMELVMSSHNMFVQKSEVNGQTIFKFDFPNINLPDSSDHAGCHGMLVYKINTVNTLPYGATIDHRAGIYFDYNSVVMTNTYTSSICVPANVVTVAGNNNIKLYPNPAGNELTVQSGSEFNECTIANSIGQQMLQHDLNGNTRINISSLSSGIYYITLKGEKGQEVLKFVKL